MKVLLLGPPTSWLIGFLEENSCLVSQTEGKVYESYIASEFDLVISYGYRHILSREFLKRSSRPVINLHISLLPFNRGAHPNLWSHIEGTPSGVTIHHIDEGVDTGEIIAQQELIFSRQTTLARSYEVLHEQIRETFLEISSDILSESYTLVPQGSFGTFHRVKDFESFIPLQHHIWQMSIDEIQQWAIKNLSIFPNGICRHEK